MKQEPAESVLAKTRPSRNPRSFWGGEHVNRSFPRRGKGSRKKVESDGSAFQGQELRFGRASTVRRKSARLAAGSGHAMAGNEERDRVLGHSLADLSSRIGLADRFRDFAIGARLSGRNCASGSVDLAEKRSHIA